MAKALMWFRQDLRITDNPALSAAVEMGELIPVYIHDTSLSQPNEPGSASKWWLHHALRDLAGKFNHKLIVKSGKPVEVLLALCEAHDVEFVVWNRMYEKWARQRDTQIKTVLKEQGIKVKSYNGSLLWEPMTVSKADGTPYKVYTPYYRKACLNQPSPRYPLAVPKYTIPSDIEQNAINSIDSLALLPSINWYDGFESHWSVTEEAAKTALQTFIEGAILNYEDDRNIPSLKACSRLSPYLHFGQISPNQIWYAVLDKFNGDMSDKGVDTYLSEIAWREFSYYLLYHFPEIQQVNFNAKFDNFAWQYDDAVFSAWTTGQTGVPIVDAGMRELWKTGYMHNRVRMIVASYLVKNLLIDWRKGERWFWDCLLDADTASNAASWQWVAGSGADAAPYFRIFNPVLQGEKFDKQGEYVKTYCPELVKLPQKYIHKPWEAPATVLSEAQITLGEDYPFPLVDLKQSRQRALDAFAAIKEA
ncbi:cryptochrome/photolyase family protein [Agaribacter flavus]|uniref:Cryptochrome/photolyase family protein n=1 Tax=Agaribacter flavus TaxID=1902781 RepID=A0ABV7FS74_9ALTE